ncbi:MAG: hypothetical protein ACK4WD_14785 [Flavobacteriales bacterium]|jgi:hypothetical protein
MKQIVKYYRNLESLGSFFYLRNQFIAMQVTMAEVNKQHVEKRVRDWKKRVASLYSEIKLWMKDSEYSFKLGSKLTMYEELMSQFGVPATEIDTADIHKGKQFILTIKPKGLWIIGANGRIDILTTKGNYMLVDSSEQFSSPQWKLFNGDKLNGVEFNKQTFLKLLK